MRHRTHTHSFGRKQGPRLALMKGLVNSLVEHGRIRTTVAKAKELRRHVEKAITLGKSGDMHARRLLMSRYNNENTVAVIVNDLSKRFKTRAGGYTRIIKNGYRPGDNADMALIEFVDYKLPEQGTADTKVKGDKGAVKKAKAASKVRANSRKTLRKSQSKARQVSRRKNLTPS